MNTSYFLFLLCSSPMSSLRLSSFPHVFTPSACAPLIPKKAIQSNISNHIKSHFLCSSRSYLQALQPLGQYQLPPEHSNMTFKHPNPPARHHNDLDLCPTSSQIAKMFLTVPTITFLGLLCVSVNAENWFKIIVYGGDAGSACLTKDTADVLEGYYQAGIAPCYQAGGDSYNVVTSGKEPSVQCELMVG
jgi:hypothetical protein